MTATETYRDPLPNQYLDVYRFSVWNEKTLNDVRQTKRYGPVNAGVQTHESEHQILKS